MRYLYLGTIFVLMFTCASAPADKEEVVIASRDITSVEAVDSQVIIVLTQEKSKELTWREVWSLPIRFSDVHIPPDIATSMHIRQVTTSPVVSTLTFVLPDKATAKRLADALKVPAATKGLTKRWSEPPPALRSHFK
jgi:hypothetical protein